MTLESLVKARTVNEVIRSVGVWALIACVLWAVSEIRDTKTLVIQSQIGLEKQGERIGGLERRLDRLEDRYYGLKAPKDKE